MKIVVCIKQVPDTKGGVKFNPDGTLDRGAMLTIMNPDDKAGLEAALRIKDEYGAEVTVLTMGLPKADEVLREAMAMGADKGILVTDRVLGGADTWATSTTIAGAIRNLDYDLIITGRQAIDGDTAQVGPQISEHLDIPVIGLAKQDEEIYLPGRNIPISLPKRSDALRLLQRVRDETHRFATSKNQRLRTTQNTHTLFEKLPNVGPVRARKLIKKYITIKALADASNNDVAVLLHISQEQAEQIITAAIEKQYGTKRVPSQKDAPASLYRAETGNTPAGLAAQALQAAEQEESYS